MTKIRFKQTLSTITQVYAAKKEYDLPDAEAARLIAAGIAEEVTESVSEPMDRQVSTAKADRRRSTKKQSKAEAI
jgi:hypothetical protein